MGLDVATGRFGTGTGAVSTTVSVTGLSFQPKAVIFFGNGRTDTIDAVGGASIKPFIGFATSSSDERGSGGWSTDGAATTVTGATQRTDSCVVVMLGSSAADGQLEFTSFNADGFTLTVTNQFSADFQVGYIALGGSDLTSVATGSFDTGTGTTNTDITSVGFQPDCLITVGVNRTTENTAGTPLTFNVGIVDTALNQAVSSISSQNGVTTTNTWRYGRSGDGYVTIGSSGSTHQNRGAVVAWLSNGFTISRTVNLGSRRFYFLALKGGKYTVGTAATQTDTTTDITESGFGYTPKGVFVLSHGTTESTAGTSQAHGLLSMGATATANAGAAFSVFDQDAVATGSEAATAIRVDKVYASITTADAIDGVMNLQSFDSDGLTFRMSDADASAAFFSYLAFGETAATPGGAAHAAIYRIRRTQWG